VASGDGLGLFFNLNRTPCGGPNYVIPPTVVPSSFVGGAWYTGSTTLTIDSRESGGL
jgi:hypothetical protein